MRLNAKPPAGAGKVTHPTLTDRLLQVIDGLGSDKYGNPVGIRSAALAEKSGVPAKSITALLSTAVANGKVVMCKITLPGQKQQINEYRKGGGLPPPEFKPLNPKKTGLAGTSARRTVSTALVPVSTVKPPVTEIEPPQLGHQPQPAVGQNTGSARSVSPSTFSAEARAVAPVKETPKSNPERRRPGPARVKASAGDAWRLNLESDGTLLIVTEEGMLELEPGQTRKLGHFLGATHGAWDPF